ncbi:hypothetical protein [Polynucleobacter nymphae]|uniref:hypothetical protein n=1 Tax=Polynucleobacter nymphae TaxID=2081043 RepID=UPI001C0E0C9D|nr:hypothetical protein [Polynucleobacter nymphae]MBU3606868.1 hypothetical protein [Polynucleobacter nymphae]
MHKITEEQRNLFNPYRNVSFIFKKKLNDKDNTCVTFESDIRFDEDTFHEDNFSQNIQISIFDLRNDPMEHRNKIHPIANEVARNCKLELVLFTGQPAWARGNPQEISFTKKEGGYSAFLYSKVKDVAYLNAISSNLNKNSELSVKLDLLCDDSEFINLEKNAGLKAVVHGLSISFNLPKLEELMSK